MALAARHCAHFFSGSSQSLNTTIPLLSTSKQEPYETRARARADRWDGLSISFFSLWANSNGQFASYPAGDTSDNGQAPVVVRDHATRGVAFICQRRSSGQVGPNEPPSCPHVPHVERGIGSLPHAPRPASAATARTVPEPANHLPACR